ncbi:hypothetical protein BH20ACT5_BH20ACT5_23630 [soil metagenome]
MTSTHTPRSASARVVTRTDGPRPAFLDRPLASFYLVVGSGVALLALGLLMVASASSVDSMVDGGSPYDIFARQALWVLLGLPAMWLGMRLRPASFRRLAYPGLIVSLVLLGAVLVPGIGVRYNGARSWFDLGPMSLQPSELAKLAFVFWGADLLVRKRKRLGEWRHLLVPLVPIAVLLVLLVTLQPDLGTSMCFLLILLGLLWTVGAPARLFAVLLVAAVGSVAAIIAMEPYRLVRVTSFLDPFADPEGAGMQAVRGMYALATGGWWGVGLGNSRMKWGLLPNQDSDYIFAIIGEELGFVGCLFVLGLYGTLAYAGLRIARRTADPFIRLTAAAVTVWLVGQASINIGYVVGLLPVTGIPLPLISTGGTSLVLTMFVMGMLASFARHEPQAVAALKQRGPSRLARLLWIPVPRSAVDAPTRRRPRGTAARPRGAPPRTGGAASPRTGGAAPRTERPARPHPAARGRGPAGSAPPPSTQRRR